MALGPALAGTGVLLAAILAGAVYRDATRVGVGRPAPWAAFVFLSVAVGLTLPVVVPSVPIPGALVFLLVGPALYAFERDDTLHGDEGAEPGTLPTGDRSDEE